MDKIVDEFTRKAISFEIKNILPQTIDFYASNSSMGYNNNSNAIHICFKADFCNHPIYIHTSNDSFDYVKCIEEAKNEFNIICKKIVDFDENYDPFELESDIVQEIKQMLADQLINKDFFNNGECTKFYSNRFEIEELVDKSSCPNEILETFYEDQYCDENI